MSKLPDLIPVCPYCKRGFNNGEFLRREVVVACVRGTPHIEDDGRVEWLPYEAEDLHWDEAKAVDEMPEDHPFHGNRYECLSCGLTFNEFLVMRAEEFAWHHMMHGVR